MANYWCRTIALILISLQFSWSLQCYECSYGVPSGTQACLDPTPETVPIKRKMQDDPFGQGCSEFVGCAKKGVYTEDVCVGMIGDLDCNTNSVIRCKSGEGLSASGCTQWGLDITGKHFSGYICFCHTDLCNKENTFEGYGSVIFPWTTRAPPVQLLKSSGILLTIGLLIKLLTTATVIIFFA